MQTLVVHSNVNTTYVLWLKKIRHVNLHMINPSSDSWPNEDYDVILIEDQLLNHSHRLHSTQFSNAKIIVLGENGDVPKPLVDKVTEVLPADAPLNAFIKTLSKVYKQRGGDSVQRIAKDDLLIKSDGLFFQLELAEICCLESMRDYVLFRTEEVRFVVHTTLKSVQELLLDRPEFMQIHRSYVVNTVKICEKTHNSVLICDQYYPVSRTNKHKLKYLMV